MQRGSRTPRQFLISLVLVAAALTAALAWLGGRVLQQDRALETQRAQERLDSAANLVVAALARRLSELDYLLNSLATIQPNELPAAAVRRGAELPAGALLVVAVGDTIDAYPSARLIYYPVAGAVPDDPEAIFAAAESFEFVDKDYARAIEILQRLAKSSDEVVRAGALVRLARNLHKKGDIDRALRAYEELSTLGSRPVAEGIPAGLLARYARCELLERLNQTSRLKSEASALGLDLQRGRWRVHRTSYFYYSQAVARWLGAVDGGDEAASLAPDKDALGLAAGVQSIWDEWQRVQRGQADLAGSRTFWVDGRPVFALWRGAGDRLVALVGGPRYLEGDWLTSIQPLLARQGIGVALTDPNGRAIVDGTKDAPGPQVVRSVSETRLPWTLRIVSADPALDSSRTVSRRRLVLVELAVVGLILMAAAYVIGRAVTREIQAARLQSDFVAAVSHEFRSPLTVVRQLTELLASERAGRDEHERRKFYGVLAHEAQRLHRLVENLLDFGRMEAGARAYRMEPLEMTTLVREVITEFEQQVSDRGYRIELDTDGSASTLRGDREAIGRALWNLLDNAVKYSPDCRTIRVELARESGRVAIRVRDRGLGIPPAEQQAIFRKFNRGSAAEATNAKGTGIGLSMVRHIVEGHGGQILVESAPAAGTTFTMFFPIEA